MTTAYQAYGGGDPEYKGPDEFIADAMNEAANHGDWCCPCCAQPLRDLEWDFYVPSVAPSWWKDSEKAWFEEHKHEFLACDICGTRWSRQQVEEHFGEDYDAAKRIAALKEYYGEDYEVAIRENLG